MSICVWLAALIAVMTPVTTSCASDEEQAPRAGALDCADLVEVLAELSGGDPVPLPGGASAIFNRFDAPDQIRADRALVAQVQTRADAELRAAGVQTGKGLEGYSVEELEQIAKTSLEVAGSRGFVEAVGRIVAWAERTCPEG